MKEVTATEAARGFSALLTAVEKDGETFFVTRGGRVIAVITEGDTELLRFALSLLEDAARETPEERRCAR